MSMFKKQESAPGHAYLDHITSRDKNVSALYHENVIFLEIEIIHLLTGEYEFRNCRLYLLEFLQLWPGIRNRTKE